MRKKIQLLHPRLLISAITGIAIYFPLPAHWGWLTRVLVAWNAFAILFLILVTLWMARLSVGDIRSRYAAEDESAPFILIMVIAAALLSLIAIVDPLATMRHVAGAERAGHIALAASTLANSWLLVPVMFASHYADMFYKSAEKSRPLHFPETTMPAFWDFAYFSFTIAAACQTSDVLTLNAKVRKAVIAHTVISFLFNAAILGFAINVTAGLIGAG